MGNWLGDNFAIKESKWDAMFQNVGNLVSDPLQFMRNFSCKINYHSL